MRDWENTQNFLIFHTFRKYLNCGAKFFFGQHRAECVLIFFWFHDLTHFDVKIFEIQKNNFIKIFLDTKPIDCLKGRILSRTSSEQSGTNWIFGFFLLGFKYTLRTCFKSKNFLPKSCPELSNQVLSFSEGQIY